ncbi:putative LPS assembly protein LptD [Aureibacter tunicatorum]|uniref:Lipopolysaccharide assembly outer membrane protein LptD (OstA) n=1 Tax=Aureibacter tunicatorum TaxID=866807 RepID=A0AAE3XIF9_9BACT|nr:putative LPS assembly protein LptD [Aureibacter tunicatorum]MDR6238326.1 lipopolysaccharide assembly outer membrane protein LptD (OstA) [Aureibacter tunicatorum]
MISPTDTTAVKLATQDSASLAISGDTTAIAENDSLINVQQPVGDIETEIDYKSTDSLKIDLKTQFVTMYGEGEVNYGKFKLEADRIKLNYSTNVVDATGTTDSTGTVYGTPLFTDDGHLYETDTIKYNFKSQKSIIRGVVTQEGEGYIHGDKIKRVESGEAFVDHAKYTTCNLPEPHFHIDANKIKMIPGKKFISGPFNMKIANIPTPLWLPFGFFPMPNNKSSGIIIPTFGEEIRRGFFLREGGYYFHFNDYIDLTATGEIYSKGSWGVALRSNYRKRYAFSGNWSFQYNHNDEGTEAQESTVDSYWIRWTHSPQSRPGAGRFSASVNFGSSRYNQENPSDIDNNLSQNFSSAVSYSKTLGKLFNFSANANLNQNVSTGVIDLTFPQVSFNMNRVNPFQKKGKSAQTWYEKINFTYSMNASNRLTNNRVNSPSFPVDNPNPMDSVIIDFTPENFDEIWKRSQNGFQHRIPVSTSFKILKYFTLSPNFNWNEIHYFKKLDYTWIENGGADGSGAVRIDTLGGLQRVYSFNGGANLNTRLYGTAYFKSEKIQAIRHVMAPTVSMSFSPDFGADRYGYYQDVQVNNNGDTRRLSRYEGFLYGTPTSGKQANMSFSISNTLEMKVLSKNDTTGKAKIVPILENFSISTNYNFAADSFNLSPFSLVARTSLFNKKLSINWSGTIDPYVYVLENVSEGTNGEVSVRQRRTSQYAWNAGQGIGQLSSWNLALSTRLSPKGMSADDRAKRYENELRYGDNQAELDYLINHPDTYVDWNVPWNLSLNLNMNYNKTGFQDSKITASMRFNGDVSLTEKWKITYNSGYDFVQREFTQTNLGILRDLHCWEMRVDWTPFGRYTSYSLTIQAKSSLLRDLKLNRQNSWRDQY